MFLFALNAVKMQNDCHLCWGKKEEKSCVALHRINLTIKKNVMAVFFAF